MVSLSHSIAFWDDYTLCTLNRSAHVGIQLSTFHSAIAMDGIHLTIVVEEHTEVVDVSLHVVVLPRTANVFRGVALQSFAIHVGINIKLSVGISDARSPDALSVYLLMIFQRKAVFWKIKAVEAVAHILPVYEVL